MQLVEQIGQVQRARAGRVLIAVDGLAQQGHFQAAVVGQAADLVDDLGGRPALLGPADPRHDAIGAELVAAEHHPHHRLGLGSRGEGRGERGEAMVVVTQMGTVPFFRLRPAGHKSGEALLDRRPVALAAVETHLDPRAAAGGHLFQERRQLAQLAGPNHQIDVRSAAEDLLLVLLGHAAQDADDRARAFFFEKLQPAQGAVDFVLGMLAHAARIQQDRIRAAGAIDQLMARPQQVGGDQLAVEHVHLATNCLDIATAGHGTHCSRGEGREAREEGRQYGHRHDET